MGLEIDVSTFWEFEPSDRLARSEEWMRHIRMLFGCLRTFVKPSPAPSTSPGCVQSPSAHAWRPLLRCVAQGTSCRPRGAGREMPDVPRRRYTARMPEEMQWCCTTQYLVEAISDAKSAGVYKISTRVAKHFKEHRSKSIFLARSDSCPIFSATSDAGQPLRLTVEAHPNFRARLGLAASAVRAARSAVWISQDSLTLPQTEHP